MAKKRKLADNLVRTTHETYLIPSPFALAMSLRSMNLGLGKTSVWLVLASGRFKTEKRGGSKI